MKAIILAAGFGTRMLPITKTIPKELLPVGNKPVIQYSVEALVDAGINDIIIVTSQGKTALEDYFDKNYELEELLLKKGKMELLDMVNKPKDMANYCFVKQKEQLGTGHAVLQVEKWLSDDFFIVVYGDAIYPPDVFVELLNKFSISKSPFLVIHQVPKSDVYKYGVVKILGENIIDIVEKPNVEDAPSDLISSGIFLLPSSIFSFLKETKPDQKSGEIYLPDAIKKLIETTDVGFLKVRPFWDVGSPDALLDANVYFSKNGRLF